MSRSLAVLRGIVAALALAAAMPAASTSDADYLSDLAAWRKRADDNLRKDLGWLTIAGRWELKPGNNTLGSAPGNDVVLPRELAPARLGKVRVEPDRVTLLLQPGVRMWTEPEAGKRGDAFTERVLKTKGDDTDWVSSGRLSLYVFTRDDGKSVLRIADRESPNRKRFAGRVWYAPRVDMRVPARFVAYPPGTKIPIANVRGEITEEDAAGRVEVDLAGKRVALDAFAEDDGRLFMILRDETSGSTTYGAGRFLVADKPVDGRTTVDFNKAYNPPCAFSAYTTCPLPPPQNWLKMRIAAGERYGANH